MTIQELYLALCLYIINNWKYRDILSHYISQHLVIFFFLISSSLLLLFPLSILTTYIHIHTYVHIHIHIHMYTQIDATYTYAHTCIHINTCTDTEIDILGGLFKLQWRLSFTIFYGPLEGPMTTPLSPSKLLLISNMFKHILSKTNNAHICQELICTLYQSTHSHQMFLRSTYDNKF